MPQDTAPALDTVRKNGDVRMHLDFELFRGVSVQLHDLEKANKLVDELAALPSIKRWWPVTLHNVPDAQVHWAGNPDREKILQARDNSTLTNNFSPHFMTQIDKLHAKGYTGKGVHVAVIDTGVSLSVVAGNSRIFQRAPLQLFRQCRFGMLHHANSIPPD